MHKRAFRVALLLLPMLLTRVHAQGPLPILDDKPIPMIDAGGPSATVTSLAFAPDGKTLYCAGFDKVVHVWKLDNGHFVLQRTFHVPVGPGIAGAIGAIALSPDGAWLAIGGRAPMRNEATFRSGGVLVEASDLSADQLADQGVIYVASTANPVGGKVLRGHVGAIRALAFAPADQGKPPLLVSAATNLKGQKPFSALHLWDITTGKLLAERKDLPISEDRPGLAVWHNGAGVDHVRVAVSWPAADKKKTSIRLWDLAPNADPLQSWPADDYTRTAARVGPDTVLVGGFGADAQPPAGRLRLWRFSADRDTKATAPTVVDFPSRPDAAAFLPVGLTLVPTADGPPRFAAVVLRPNTRIDYRLAVVDLTTKKIVIDFPLVDSDLQRLPVVTASGRFIAVSATKDHAVRVYAVEDLVGGKLAPQDVLTSVGLVPRQVAFVDGGKSLWLNKDLPDPATPGLRGGLIFDFDKRQVRANDRADLAPDSPKLGEWSFAIDKDRKGVTVRQGAKELPPLRLKGKDEEVTAAALRPASPGQPAVLAVAYTERDAMRTWILLVDPVDSRPFRHLVGHVDDVRGLAFSGTRPLLASVADDQTICIWRLGDLDTAQGQITGCSVVEGENKKIVIRRVEAGGLVAQAGLADGDVIEALAAGGAEAKPVKDIAQLIAAVAVRRPGDTIALTIVGKGAVKLIVGRGMNIRKPLFSLFMVRGKAVPQWVGWSPAGPYDASGPVAEALLGWHTNTGDPAAPVSFAGAQKYQKEYRREGILNDLATAADLSRALNRWKERNPDRVPQAFLIPDRPDAAIPGDADEFVVRQPLKALRININADYPLDDKHVLRWRVTRVDGGKVVDGVVLTGTAARDGDGWQLDLSAIPWRRGEYRVWLGLHSRADATDPVSQTITNIRFQPPAPTLSVRREDKPLETSQDAPLKVIEGKVTLQIAVAPEAGQQAEATFFLERNGVAQKDVPAARAGTFVQDFKLQEGVNRLAVRAVNKDALAGHEDVETTAAVIWVSFKGSKELPPRFTDVGLDAEAAAQRIDGKDVLVVGRALIRLTGKVTAQSVLVRASSSVGDAAPRSFLPEREVMATEFAADLNLKPGEVVPVRLEARSRNSDEIVEVRWLLFNPTLPEIAIDALNSPDIRADTITLTGSYKTETKDPFDLTFRVTTPDGKFKPYTPELNPMTGTWKVQLKLSPGTNNVDVLAANRWRPARVVAGPLSVRFLRPPRITKAPTEVKARETNKVSLDLTVEGPIDRPLQRFTVNDKPVRFVANEPQTQGDRWVWSVKLPEVFVSDGEQNLKALVVRAISDEGAGPETAIAVDHVMVPQPPLVRFLNPTVSDTARRPAYAVRFRVESSKPLESVAIWRNGAMIAETDLKKVVREGNQNILQEEVLVQLKNGINTLELIAVNSDGRNSPRAVVVISYTEPAVLVSIDRVEIRNPTREKQLLRPVYSANGDMTLPVAPASLVWLVGHIRWSDPKAAALQMRNLDIVVRVGDCRQFPGRLGARGLGDQANVRSFEVPAVLIGAENRIKLEFPTVSQEDASRGVFDLACAAPSLQERLHLVVIGVNVKDAVKLKERVLDALAVSPKERPVGLRGEFSKKPFARCVLYQVLVGEVDRGKVEGQLAEINKTIKELQAKTGWINDLVLIYYQGEDLEVPEKNERWLKTSRNYQFPGPPQEWAIPCHALPRVPGAQLLLLNVTGGPDQRMTSENWGGDPDSGLLRYAIVKKTDVAIADSELLGLMKGAAQKHAYLGDMIRAVNEQVARMTVPISPYIVLDQDQARRRFNEPAQR